MPPADASRAWLHPGALVRAALAGWAGRLLLGGLAVRLLSWLAGLPFAVRPSGLDLVDAAGSLALLSALAIWLYGRLSPFRERRLLWSVRRRLILSYMFIGVVPALLIAGFFLLVIALLVTNLGSYLVKTELQHLADEAGFLAASSAAEIDRNGLAAAPAILGRRRESFAARYPGISLAVVPTVDPPCAGADPGGKTSGAVSMVAAGPWRHGTAPPVLPPWVPCGGFNGIVASAMPAGAGGAALLLIRAAGLPADRAPSFAVVIDIPVDEQIRRTIHATTGIEPGPAVIRAGAGEQSGDQAVPQGWIGGSGRPVVFDGTDWTSGRTVSVEMWVRTGLAELYHRVWGAASGSNMGLVIAVGVLFVGGLFLVIEIVALVMGLALARSITGAVHELFIGTVRVRQGDFTHKIPIAADDQLGELAESFNLMTGSIESLLRQADEKKRLEEELRIAREIQQSLLPRGRLGRPGVAIDAVCVPAREVGGDYYDIFHLDEGRLGILIADVSGKGTSAAFYMAELKGLMLSLTRIYRSPRQLLIEANRIISEHLDSRSFITLIYAVLDPGARTLTYCRAGHTPLIHRASRMVGARTRVHSPGGLVLGLKVDGGRRFAELLDEAVLTLDPGDTLVLYTDGISEAMNREADCFGEARLRAIIDEHGHLPFDALRARILGELDRFVGGAPQHDDMTMILVRIEETAEPAACVASDEAVVHG